MPRTWLSGLCIAASALVISAAGVACATRDRMCVAPTECGAAAACVAGRCQLRDGSPALAELGEAGAPAVRRVVAEPVDVAYLAPGAPDPAGRVPPLVVLGRGDGARLLLRFSVPLAPEEQVVEAYLLLTRSDAVDSDPAPAMLHVRRIADAWDSRTVRWALQPRLVETGAPATVVTPAGRGVLRLDVRELVSRWSRREKDEHGLAVVEDTSTATGLAVAATAVPTVDDPGLRPLPPGPALAGPRLELYLRGP